MTEPQEKCLNLVYYDIVNTPLVSYIFSERKYQFNKESIDSLLKTVNQNIKEENDKEFIQSIDNFLKKSMNIRLIDSENRKLLLKDMQITLEHITSLNLLSSEFGAIEMALEFSQNDILKDMILEPLRNKLTKFNLKDILILKYELPSSISSFGCHSRPFSYYALSSNKCEGAIDSIIMLWIYCQEYNTTIINLSGRLFEINKIIKSLIVIVPQNQYEVIFNALRNYKFALRPVPDFEKSFKENIFNEKTE